MKTPINLLFLFFCCAAFGQGIITFKQKQDELYVNSTTPTLREAYIIDAASLPVIANSNIQVVISNASTLPNADYVFTAASQNNDNVTDYNFFIDVNIPIDNLKKEYDKYIKFDIVIKDIASGAIVYQNNNFYAVKVTNKKALSDYRYLAYVGTNFDLVDGIQAKNLFFATNIYLKPVKKIGFNISLYGNRAISRIDSILDYERPSRIFDSLGNIYRENKKMDIVKNIQTDNLGANFSLLYKLWDIDTETQLFYSGQLEFIYRRIRMDIRYTNIRTLSLIPEEPGTTTHIFDMPTRQLSQYSVYDFNVGALGFMLCHENERMSIRLFMNTGYAKRYMPANAMLDLRRANMVGNDIYNDDVVNSNYVQQEDIFYSGRLWITERTSGITLQAEITNGLNHAAPFYGVTLSKAFDFEKIGSIFSPISSR